MSHAITIHTDGSCRGNPGKGGFAALIECEGMPTLTVKGGDSWTTNQRMELSAVLEAFRAVNARPELRHADVTVRSDSKYVIDAFNKRWHCNWTRNGWRTFKGKPVANRAIWESLLAEVEDHAVTWLWVKGHRGDEMNDQCDRIAVAEAAKARTGDHYWVNAPPPDTPLSKSKTDLDAAGTPEEAPVKAAPETTPQPNTSPDALRLLEAMQVALEECHSFEEFRERMLRTLQNVDW